MYFYVSITDCKYTCHRRCRGDVDLDCTGGWQFERNLSVDEMTMKTLHLVDQVMLIDTCLVLSLVMMKLSRCLSGMASGESSCLPLDSMAWIWRPLSYLGRVCCWFSSFLDTSKFQFDLETVRRATLSWMCYCKLHMYAFYELWVNFYNFIHRSMNWSVFVNCRVKKEKSHLCFTQILQLEVSFARRLMNSIHQQLGL